MRIKAIYYEADGTRKEVQMYDGTDLMIGESLETAMPVGTKVVHITDTPFRYQTDLRGAFARIENTGDPMAKPTKMEQREAISQALADGLNQQRQKRLSETIADDLRLPNTREIHDQEHQPMAANKEGKIENYLRDEVKRLGGKCLKWISPGNKGVPDRIVFLPNTPAIFVEVKAEDGKLSDHQEVFIQEMRELGTEILVISSELEVDLFIDEYETSSP